MEPERKCERWYGFKHKFDQWRVREDSTITRGGDKSKEVIGRWLLQERKCLRCGFVELNKQEIKLN
jgi:hypothetical protein